MRVYGVTFKDNGKIYNFSSLNEIEINSNVIVDTDKGLQFGKVVSIVDNIDEIETNELREIIRVANEDDYQQYINNLKDAEIALKKCKNLVAECNLNMNIISAQFNFDKTQLLFNFVSEERVDFRELARKLASIYHTRIELRQVGARDKAKEIGGIGVCGQKICCVQFLGHIEAVSMNMAKNQNLALNPSKINGVCGRLLCCLQYEDEQYIESSKELPSYGDIIKTPHGEGQVVNVDILNRKVKVLINGNKEEVEISKNGKVSKK